MQAPVGDHAVQHLFFVQAIHHYEPIDHFAAVADGEALARSHQRNNVAISVEGKTAIEPELGPASRLAAGQRREIEVGEMHRFLELVDPIAGKKHFRHMGLVTGDLGHRRAINVAPDQEFDLVGERRFRWRKRLQRRVGGVVLDQHKLMIKPSQAGLQLTRINLLSRKRNFIKAFAA